MQRFALLLAVLTGPFATNLIADDLPPHPLTLTLSNGGIKTVTWPRALLPALDTNRLMVSSNLPVFSDVPATNITSAASGYTYRTTNALPQQFYNLQLIQMNSNALLTANVLNRLAYGPTPDDIEHILTDPNGPQAYIDQQLAPETISETADVVIQVTTNSAAAAASTNWSSITVTGTVTSSLFYMYLTAPGDVYVDDVELKLQTTTYATNITYSTNGAIITTNTLVLTNVALTTNLLANGDFESPLFGTGTNGWKVSPILTTSYISPTNVCSGTGSLHMVSTGVGSTQGSAIWQQILPQAGTGNSNRWVLSFRYLPNTNSGKLLMRVSSSGTAVTAYKAPPTPTWVYATATGVATGTPRLYVYLDDAGEAYIDDIKLVSGSVPEAGSNLLQNGGFETALTGPWQRTANFSNSVISSTIAHGGTNSLKVVATAGGSGSGNAIFQDAIAGVTNNGTYTVSFWYVSESSSMTVRLSGSGTANLLTSNPDDTLAGIKRRLDNIGGVTVDTGGATAQAFGGATLPDLRAWFVMNAVGSKRQLLEVLDEFLENHFVTEHAKSFDYFDAFYDGTITDILATDWEYREHAKWRAALLNPTVTFYDLLRISAESPAMIVYLDTVDSTGDGAHVANENYAREIMELFCMGVDNGYDQHDIEAQSRAWTGWSVDIVDRANINNPFAPSSLNYGFYPGVGFGNNVISNKIGAWTFNYKAGNHGTNRAPIFSVWHTNSTSTNLIPLGPKLVPSRFGPPWAGMNYQLVVPPRATGTTNSIQDGYDVIAHLANLPFTMEFISVKLCRLFVHDDFVHGVYDYADTNRTAEAELIRQCMSAWWNSNPKGQLRPVLNTIFSSDLFRSHAGSLQKVKTPLEYAVSTIRALRSTNANGTATANTDGYSISGRDRTAGSAPLTRMGQMMLFDRGAPDGYPETGPPWISAGTLAERIRYVQTCLMSTSDTNKNDGISGGNNSLTDPVALLKKKLPGASWNNAGDVADYFLSILYPAEGKANLDLYRALAVNFLNKADDGVTNSSFLVLSNTTANYDTRVRGMVAMLMTLQRFHEQ